MYEFLLKIAAIAPITIPLAALVAVYGIKVQKNEKKLEKSLGFSQEISQHPIFNESFKTVINLISNRLEIPLSNYASEYRVTDEAHAIRIVLNEFERMAAGIKYNVYDEDFLFSSHSFTTESLYRRG